MKFFNAIFDFLQGLSDNLGSNTLPILMTVLTFLLCIVFYLFDILTPTVGIIVFLVYGFFITGGFGFYKKG
jgi:hypothetical protein